MPSFCNAVMVRVIGDRFLGAAVVYVPEMMMEMPT